MKKRAFASPLFLTLALVAGSSRGQAPTVVYPALGHLQAGEGAIEFWLRLEAEPGAAEGQIAYFPIFNLTRPGELQPRIGFVYQKVWAPEHLHFFFSSWGIINGAEVSNGYITTLEETQKTTKADVGGKRYPRTPRLKKGEWHYFALTWQGDPQAVALYLDSEQVLFPTVLKAPIWEGLPEMSLNLLTGPYAEAQSLDELRISSIARKPEEIRQAFKARKAATDRFTLLLDPFEEIRKDGAKWETIPTVFTGGLDCRGGVIARTNSVELVEGPSGKALRLLNR